MSHLQTVSNALDILTALGKSDDYLSVEKIAEYLNVPESTTYRLLQTLEAKGFVERHSRNNIGLGSSLLSLSRNIHDKLDKELALIANPWLEKITEESRETSILSIRTDIYSKCIKSVSSQYIIRFVAEKDRLLKLSVGASSKAILAFENERVIKSVLDTLSTDEEKEALLKELQDIREKRYAISSSEYDLGAVGFGVPVFNSLGQIYASLAIVGPDTRLKIEDRDRFVELLQTASQDITSKLR